MKITLWRLAIIPLTVIILLLNIIDMFSILVSSINATTSTMINRFECWCKNVDPRTVLGTYADKSLFSVFVDNFQGKI